jgi:hypothetical protein
MSWSGLDGIEKEDVKKAARAVRNLEEVLAPLIKKIEAVQKKCPHDNLKPVYVFDKNYFNRLACPEFGENIFVGNECLDCFTFIPRSGGSPSEICHRCGGKMKFDGITRGEDGGIFISTCEMCGHRYGHR